MQSRFSKTAATLGLAAALNAGCATGFRQADTDLLDAYRNNAGLMTDDPYGNMRYMKNGEFIIPDNVMGVYRSVLDSTSRNTVAGAHIDDDHLTTEGDRSERFSGGLRGLGYSDEDINTFYTILTAAGNIVVTESALHDSTFTGILSHERYHKEMGLLSDDELDLLHGAYEDLIDRTIPHDSAEAYGIPDNVANVRKEHNEKIYMVMDQLSRGCIGCARQVVQGNWREFYPRLSDGLFEDRAEEALRKDHPEAFEIFDRIREDVRIEN